ncbi:hypothetical protein [Flavobacterium caseinilyticum]|uniref:Cell wall anchor protein n=1 Tax=Flavobacterium caseinilyticum TaxID=2541732 RepID=A0A4R5B1N0_9FLAO|nr:hypothetical protein [Flavobacterium caseinilyticum]TDD78539.1 hypothetical protein E0F89_02580 [Flavobacterium caseinilyticum]
MKKQYFAKKVSCAFMLLLMTITSTISAQVGIGTITPHASSVLDVSSTTQGMLAPRMTTAQRTAIVSPADGLMVYDTDLKSLFHYNSSITSWNVINSGTNGRLKFKRIKSTDVLATVLNAEKTAGGGTKYLLDAGTLYEINGQILLDLPIELNNAYIAGQDSGEDKLVKVSGDLFTGTSGGSIRVVTLVASGGNVFNISGDGNTNLILRDCIIANSANVGLLKGFSLVFVSIVQYVGNTNGIVYENIKKLLINNAGWFGGSLPLGNSGTYEKIVGEFGQVAKQGGFSEVIGSSIGFDVSANPIINASATIESVVFSGALTTGKYVNGYSPAIYSGYNFNNSWDVRCAGIPTEGDAVAVGDINFDYAVGSGVLTGFSGSGVKTKVAGVTTSNNLLRFSIDATNNRLKYLGKKKRYFNASGSLSFQSSTDASTYILYVAKNGTVINQSKVYTRSNSTNDVLAIPLNAIVELSTNDYIEVWAERFSGTGNMLTVSMNLVVD